jgi:RNA polymerase sigma factor (sigma-70 family)
MDSTQELSSLVRRAQAGELGAFETLTRRCQDLAVGYAYSLLGDWGLAEDAAQEAFIQLYHDLPRLRAPEAFLAWFPRIVFKHCDRQWRAARPEQLPLEAGRAVPSDVAAAPADRLERAAAVRQAIDALPEPERAAVMLFYFEQASLKDSAQFLGVTPSVVDHRLRSARKHLSERLWIMAEQDLSAYRPSNDARFVTRVMDGLTRLANPAGLEARLGEEIQLSLAGGEPFGLALYDLDTFTRFNDQWGHVAGDCLIAALAAQMRAQLRPDDFVARFAGEEFALVLRRDTLRAALAVADDLRAAVARSSYRFQDLLLPAARYTGREAHWPPSPANAEFQNGLRLLLGSEVDAATAAFKLALAQDANHVPTIMELAYIDLRQALSAAQLAQPLQLTLSGGLAWYQPADTVASLIVRADQCLARAKANGRNQVVFADDSET